MQRMRLGPKSFVFVFHPDAAHEILIKKASIYPQNRYIYDRIKPVTGKRGLVQLEGSESAAARAKTKPMFDAQAFQRAQAIIESLTDDMIQELSNSPSFDVSSEMTNLILNTAFKIFLDMEPNELTHQIGQRFSELNHACGYRMRSLFCLPFFVPTPRNLKIKRLEKEIRSLLLAYLLKHKGNTSKSVPHLFSDNDSMLDHCLTFLFAGHETTAASLSFTLLLLSRYPQYQKEMTKGNDDVTLAVYKESLRLFPPAYMLVRQAAEADTLSGFEIKKSDQIIIGIDAIQRNPCFFPNPEEFQPERFYKKLENPFAFIPFGAGPKSCIGQRLAYFEATLILKKLCQKFEFSSQQIPIISEPLITLHPKSGQSIFVQPRKQDHATHSSPREFVSAF